MFVACIRLITLEHKLLRQLVDLDGGELSMSTSAYIKLLMFYMFFAKAVSIFRDYLYIHLRV